MGDNELKKIAVLLLSVFVVSCTSEQNPVSLNNNQNGIMGGTLAADTDSPVRSVVAIVDAKDGSSCTGTLIAENIVLTAAHCVKGINTRSLQIVFHKDMNWVLSSKEPDIIQMYVRRVTSSVYHDDYVDESTEQAKPKDNVLEGSFDIGLLKFKGSLPEGYKPIEILTDDSWVDTKQEIQLFGYGVHEINLTDINPKLIPNLDELIETGEIVCDDQLLHCSSVEMFADGALRKAIAPIQGFTENEFVLNESAQGTCAGDSGGPAFIEKDSKFYLYGVTSRGGGLCNDYGVYGNISYLNSWIQDNIPLLK